MLTIYLMKNTVKTVRVCEILLQFKRTVRMPRHHGSVFLFV